MSCEAMGAAVMCPQAAAGPWRTGNPGHTVEAVAYLVETDNGSVTVALWGAKRWPCWTKGWEEIQVRRWAEIFT